MNNYQSVIIGVVITILIASVIGIIRGVPIEEFYIFMFYMPFAILISLMVVIVVGREPEPETLDLVAEKRRPEG